MAWLSVTTHASGDTPVLATVLNNIGADIRAWGGNVDAGECRLTNCAGVDGPGAAAISLKTNGETRLSVAGTGNVTIGTAEATGTLRYLDLRNDSASTGAGVDLRIITGNAAGSGLATVDVVKYATGELYINNNETAATSLVVLGANGSRLYVSQRGTNIVTCASYASNAAAIAGGLVAGDLYMVSGTDPRQIARVF